MAAKLIDLTGREFGQLRVLRRSYHPYRGDTLWRCKCSCGETMDARSIALRKGDTTSCKACEGVKRRGGPEGGASPAASGGLLSRGGSESPGTIGRG